MNKTFSAQSRPSMTMQACLRLILVSIFVILCILLPLFHFSHFFEWIIGFRDDRLYRYSIYSIHTFFDGYTLINRDYTGVLLDLNSGPFSEHFLLFHLDVDDMFLSLVSRSILFLGLFTFYVVVVSFFSAWKWQKLLYSRLVIWSTLLTLLFYSAYWIFLAVVLSSLSISTDLVVEFTLVQAPTPNLVQLVFSIIGLSCLFLSLFSNKLLTVLPT